MATAAAKQTLAEALVAFQQEAPHVAKTKEVTVKSDKGTYKFKYAPYDAIVEALREPLGKNGLAFSQLLTSTDAGHPALRTILLHRSGETLEADFPLPVRGGESAQQLGSLITYMRRYALISILGLATEEDDDANAAVGNSVKEKEQPKPRPAQNGSGVTKEQLAEINELGMKLLGSELTANEKSRLQTIQGELAR